MKIIRFLNSFLDSNTYLIEYKTNEFIIIDPCANNNLYNYLKEKFIKPELICLTHEHIDHISGTNYLKKKYPNVKIISTEYCSLAITNPKKNLSFFYNSNYTSVSSDITIKESTTIKLKDQVKLNFYPFEGHSVGGMFIEVKKAIFVGDQFINKTKTVTKLPGGCKIKLKESYFFLKKHIDKKTIIYPGHGESFPIENLRIW